MAVRIQSNHFVIVKTENGPITLNNEDVTQLVKHTQDLERSKAQLQIAAGNESLASKKEIKELKTHLHQANDREKKASNRIADLERNLAEIQREKQEIEHLRLIENRQIQGFQELNVINHERMQNLGREVQRLKDREDDLLDKIAILRDQLENEQKAHLELRVKYDRNVQAIQRIEKQRADQIIHDERNYTTLINRLRWIKKRYDTEAIKILGIASLIPFASAVVTGAFGFFTIGPIGMSIRLDTLSEKQKVLRERVELIKGPFLELHQRLQKPPFDMNVFDLNKNIKI